MRTLSPAFSLQMTGLQHPGVAEVRVHLSREVRTSKWAPMGGADDDASYLTTVPPA